VRLTTLTGNFVLYFPKVNWVHNNDIVGTAFAATIICPVPGNNLPTR